MEMIDGLKREIEYYERHVDECSRCPLPCDLCPLGLRISYFLKRLYHAKLKLSFYQALFREHEKLCEIMEAI